MFHLEKIEPISYTQEIAFSSKFCSYLPATEVVIAKNPALCLHLQYFQQQSAEVDGILYLILKAEFIEGIDLIVYPVGIPLRFYLLKMH